MPWRTLGCIAVITSILFFILLDDGPIWERTVIAVGLGIVISWAYGTFWAIVQKFRGKLD